MEESKKSEFLSKAEAFTKEMSEMVSGNGAKRSIIVIATEAVENDETGQIVGVAGNENELIRSIAKFANHEDTGPLLRRGLVRAMFESVAEKTTKKGGATINLTIK